MSERKPGVRKYSAVPEGSIGFSNPNNMIEVSEEAIAQFCNKCDLYISDKNLCAAIEPDNQARYADRGWCGWAKVDGVSGTMKGNGFESGA